MKKTPNLKYLFVAAIFLIQSCVTTHHQGERNPSGKAADPQTISAFPEISRDDGPLTQAIQKVLRKNNRKMSDQDLATLTEKIRHYFLFLGLNARDFVKAARANALTTTETEPEATVVQRPSEDPEDSDNDDDGDNTPSNLKAIQRFFASSSQFLFCADLSDWNCLEQKPLLTPSAAFRQDSKEGLGVAVNAGPALDMEVFFTEGWDNSPKAGVVDRFAERLHSDAGKSLSLAIYGIDDINGSMKPVYDEIKSHHQDPAVNLRAVVDVSGFERSSSPWVFDYVNPATVTPPSTDSTDVTVSTTNSDRWIFGKANIPTNSMHATFQYDGTPDMIRELNGAATTTTDARARIEWPTSHIMHDKFAVLENLDGKKSVWTGTANVSNHCMGTEANANMAVYIKNDTMAQAYLDEFNHMYEFAPDLNVKSRLVKSSDRPDDLGAFKVGRFHHNKVPVSQRLFNFDDGTKARIHFAPTDDAEHRVILPMLLSAKAGDEIRISMFGGTGYELVRAMQFAAAKGANVRIVFDRKLGHGRTSWIRDPVLNVSRPNPYLALVDPSIQPGTIQVKVSTWSGKNHYKAGTITRKQADGSMIAEQIIVGSQNWSSGGNDHNDENLLSIQNLTADVPSAKLFNDEFDNRLWPKSMFERRL